MPGPVFVTIASGFAVTSAFRIDRPAGALAVFVPSMTAADLRIEFATTSGGGTFFGALTRGDGTGQIFSTHSGAGPATAWIPVVPSQWARLSTPGVNQTDVRTFLVATVQRYP